MRVLFTFENPLPSREADAEVFTTTAQYLSRHLQHSRLHLPMRGGAATALAGLPALRAWAPLRPAALRHLLCGLTLVLRREFRTADIVYTRNLWVAWMSVRFGRRVVFDHYRPWGDQIPPLQFWIYRLLCDDRFLLNICHSDYARQKYLDLGIPADKLHCIRNGFEPARLQHPLAREAARRQVGIAAGQRTVVYTGRLNHKKGLELLLEAARLRPEVLFVLVGSSGDGPIEAMAAGIANLRIVPYQAASALAPWIFAADILVIPPSHKPLATFGSTVLPLKLFLYMASGRPILGGDTPDLREVLTHRETAYLCRPDCIGALVEGIDALLGDPALADAMATRAHAASRELTWDTRAQRIAGLIAAHAGPRPRQPGRWNRRHSATWGRQSLRWLVHLLRTRSWVLPPGIPLA